MYVLIRVSSGIEIARVPVNGSNASPTRCDGCVHTKKRQAIG
jgi:hypothetical protein